MDNKFNINRILVGGIAAGFVMLIVDMLSHGLFLKENYAFFAEKGILRSTPLISGLLLHNISIIVGGMSLSILYALVRKHATPGCKTAFKLGLLVGFICFPASFAMYAFHQVGATIPLTSAATSLVECTLGTIVAGSLYKD